MSCHRAGGFTLVEVLVVIAILAALVVVGTSAFIIVGTWARTTSDRQTLNVLNDALTRYKTQGGGVSGLTAGTNIRTLLGRMQNSTTWGNISHEFLNKGRTYPARSIDAMGASAAYVFYRYDTYTDSVPGNGVPTSQYPLYGQGVGSATSSGGYDNFAFNYTCSTGFLAVKDNGVTTIYSGGSVSFYYNSSTITFWSCASAVDSSYSGTITALDFNSGIGGSLSAIDVTGLSSLTSLNLNGNSLSAPTFTGPASLTTLNVGGNFGMGSLTVSGLTNLTSLTANGSSLTAVTLSNCPALTTVLINSNSLTTAAINAVYTALPNRTGFSAGSITRSSNTGSGTASIATAKNWTVN